jgi:hypothetical protein
MLSANSLSNCAKQPRLDRRKETCDLTIVEGLRGRAEGCGFFAFRRHDHGEEVTASPAPAATPARRGHVSRARASSTIGIPSTQGRAALPHEVFDQPTPFTQRGVAALPATKAKLYSRVVIKDAQAKYLGIQEDGGIRRPAARALVVPFQARLNRYGNLPRGGVRRLLARDDTFSGVVRGVGGIWQRNRDGTVRLLIAYEDQATYRPRFGFRRMVEKTARDRFDANFRRAFAEAMETARR